MTPREQPSILPRPDDRYWRRRQNRTVRRARLVRSLWRAALIVTAHAVIAGLVLFAGVRAFRQLTTTSEFALERIEFDGAVLASTDELESRMAGFLGRNLLDLNLRELDAIAANDPWVERATSKRLLPNTIRIALSEKRPVAQALVGGRGYLVGTDGAMICVAGPDSPSDLPLLVGLDGLDQATLTRTLRRGVRLVERLAAFDPHWLDGISELDLSRLDRVAVRTIAPGPELLLDPDEIERNIHAYLALRDQIGRRVGDVAYVDLRWRDRITVRPLDDEHERRSN